MEETLTDLLQWAVRLDEDWNSPGTQMVELRKRVVEAVTVTALLAATLRKVEWVVDNYYAGSEYEGKALYCPCCGE